MLPYFYPRLTPDIKGDLATRMQREELAGRPSETLNALAELLDGSRTLGEVFGEALLSGFNVQEIYDSLRIFEELGVLTESAPQLGELSNEERTTYQDQIDFFNSLQFPSLAGAELKAKALDGIGAQAALKKARVSVRGEGRAPSRLLELLVTAGVGDVRHRPSNDSENRSGDRDLDVYCPDGFDEKTAQSMNRAALCSRVPLMFYRLRGTEVECGPLVIPGSTPCYGCLSLRRLGLLSPLERMWQERFIARGLPRFPVGVDFMAIEILKFLARLAEPVVQGRLWRLSLATGEATLHTILRLPRCPECGATDEFPPVRIWNDDV
jgi:bacteriocin biosynthesis cyclodehydratase domain-containing protein